MVEDDPGKHLLIGFYRNANLRVKAASDHTTPEAIIGKLVRSAIAAEIDATI